ncbi:DUF551 domain-containing protein [Delftia acidovorans]|uniref:DUF551 domain-containing protein n=1 Tax=Delftia acidovorans TaxID=80866 RepID=A0AAJ2RAA6_DELAC|nr:DUF551 domain-containing protein [Delftia acidovorans]MDX4957877.1 DUF551 domain-containing protein [Delftia acidovorans]
MNWQPIETAPKDGSLILLGAPNGVWVGKHLPAYTSGFAPKNPWSSMLLNHDHMAERYTRPTHWMPLPAAPGAEAPLDPAGEREAFEAWFSAAHHDRLDRNMPDKSYNSPGAECAWSAWQARATSAHQTPAETLAAKESP